jgi:hypothetical protein
MTTISAVRARRALGAIRLFNGSMALIAPEAMLRRLGTDPVKDPSGIYPLRMFGVRTVLIAADLLLNSPDEARAAARRGVVIHASDALAAAAAGLRGDLPRKVAVLTTALSTLNTALAIAGSRD